MYTYDVQPCTDTETCPPGCQVAYFGIQKQPTIGLHLYGLRAAMSSTQPDDIGELKYHLGFWFRKHCRNIPDGLFPSMFGTPTATCSAGCDYRSLPAFAYGHGLPPGVDHLSQHQLKGEEVMLQVKKSRKKGKAHPKAKMLVIVVRMCKDCYQSKLAEVGKELEAAKSAVREPTQTMSGPSNTLADETSTSPAAQKIRRTQTCFCDECLNPPERYACIDDSDLED
ncbi:uncharacterized protein LOC62_07G009478 [Vanrija pseudolonga]|uniref:Uncharacterized protein n=1 Tax=Vanrija pseudolonga TaxID=143232 RepID=A0AAF0YFV4_9TREE|nr:hypothetical protein LOC62_07G009478 [Vanrija pseudolonga]